MKIRPAVFLILFSYAANAGAGVFPNLAIPDIPSLHRAALDYARITPGELSDMKRRARRAALLPQLQIGAKKTFQNDIDISMSDNVSVTSSGVTLGPTTSSLQQASDSDTSLEVKAVWSLNEVIFNHDALDIAEEARYQVRERREILSTANKLYFELQKIMEEAGKAGPAGPSKKPAGEQPCVAPLKSRADAIMADLDALTGGWFSNQIR